MLQSSGLLPTNLYKRRICHGRSLGMIGFMKRWRQAFPRSSMRGSSPSPFAKGMWWPLGTAHLRAHLVKFRPSRGQSIRI